MRAVCAIALLAGASASLRAAAPVPTRPMGPLGWSAPGHQITGAIADALINSATATRVANILGAGVTLESVGPWADTIRSDKAYAWASNLHFIDTPDWACKFTYATDCVNDVCLYGAVLNYTARAAKQQGVQQQEAVKFLVHFMGDLQQPLHVSFLSNYGGNSITGTFLGESGNMHHIWDYNIVYQRITRDFNGDQEAYTAYIVSQIQSQAWASKVAGWKSCVTPADPKCVQQWADATAALACEYAYTDETGAKIQSGFDLGEAYYEFAWPIAEEQLAKGGVLLASLLNNIWAKSETMVADE